MGEVVACGVDDTLAQAAKQMASHHHHCLPVLEDGVVVGVITDHDLLRAMKSRLEALATMRVKEVMTSDVAASGPDDPVEASLRLMRERKLSHLPVVGPEGALVGMLCLSDLVRALCTAAEPSERRELDTLIALTPPHARPRPPSR